MEDLFLLDDDGELKISLIVLFYFQAVFCLKKKNTHV